MNPPMNADKSNPTMHGRDFRPRLSAFIRGLNTVHRSLFTVHRFAHRSSPISRM
jgi:hypothetical protein